MGWWVKGKEIVEGCPKKLKDGVMRSEAEQIIEKFKGIGGVVEIS